jgi:hypothetical protein
VARRGLAVDSLQREELVTDTLSTEASIVSLRQRIGGGRFAFNPKPSLKEQFEAIAA